MSTIHHNPVEQSDFGEWLRQQRRHLDLTQTQLAEKAFCSVSTIRKLESGDLIPSHSLVEQLAALLQIPPSRHDAFLAFARGHSTEFLRISAEPSAPLFLPPAQETIYYLPAPLTGLVGREREIQSGAALLRRAHVRMITMTGPPGAGKTRLSLALGAALQTEFRHGACFVPLAPVSDPNLVLSAIAHALQVQQSSGASLAQSLHAFLRNKELLLILDNFEQIVAAAGVVGELLTAAPGVKAIVSSREPLKLYGEYEFPVPPLAVPDVAHLPAASLLEIYPAVELFVQRAQAVRPSFAVDEQNAASIAQICAWLDGLPLAIEMAAAQIKWQTPAALLNQLRQQLMALTGGPRDLSPRQQTLRGAMDWSYNLLGAEERLLFATFAVINGGARAESVAEITGIAPLRCEAFLRGLVEKSLLQCEGDPSGEARFTMLQVVREYAQTRLADMDDASDLQTRHAAHYARLVTNLLPGLRTAAEETLNRLEREHNNLRSALEWYRQTEVDAGLDLAIQLGESLWSIHGHFNEGRGWLEKLLAVAPEPDGEDLGQVGRYAASWLAAAKLALGQGDLSAATGFARRSEVLALYSESDKAVRAVLRCRAAICLQQSDYVQARALFQQALDLCHPETEQLEAARILNGLGLIAKDQGDYGAALDYHQRSYTIFAAVRDTLGMARVLTYMSIVAYWQGAFGRCIDYAQQSIAVQKGIGDVMSVTYSREVEAIARVRLGQIEEGIQTLQECAAAFQQMNDQSGVAVTLVDLGQAAYLQGQMNNSLGYHFQALRLASTIGDRRRIAFSLDGIGMALAQLARRPASNEDQMEEAVFYFAAAHALREAIRAPLPEIERTDYEECRALVSSSLPAARYTLAWQRGCAMPLDQLPQLILPLSIG
ncbi:MAG: tetratricopeptide repeat protein [Caldilineaceae bacterium]|nr:tetratricopeptide repeat protein [Caldilineaceae bacterium]